MDEIFYKNLTISQGLRLIHTRIILRQSRIPWYKYIFLEKYKKLINGRNLKPSFTIKM